VTPPLWSLIRPTECLFWAGGRLHSTGAGVVGIAWDRECRRLGVVLEGNWYAPGPAALNPQVLAFELEMQRIPPERRWCVLAEVGDPAEVQAVGELVLRHVLEAAGLAPQP